MFGFLNAVTAFDPSRGVPFKVFASKCMSNSISSAATAPAPEVLVDDETQEALSVDPNSDPLDLVIGSEALDRVLAECEVSLSKIEKTVIFLRASGMSYAEIGEKLGMTEKAVDNAVQRARKKLKSALTE
jgi:RNA polymerase sporulation-specific sigma factor